MRKLQIAALQNFQRGKGVCHYSFASQKQWPNAGRQHRPIVLQVKTDSELFGEGGNIFINIK